MASSSDSRRKSPAAASSESSAPTVEGASVATTGLAAGSPNRPPEPPRKFLGKYKIERTLGAGGMGSVYLATDMELRRQVALKILPKDKAENPRLVKRFEVEAQAAAQLRHENIVAVYDYGKIDGQYFIALEFVDGTDAHQLVSRRGVVPVRRSIEIVSQAATALQHAFEMRIVHRDIKPSNLLIRRDGLVKLADLGLARSIDETLETGITRAGTTVGTVDYMSPEQARDSKSADIRSDIYSLGCTWYHLLTGSCPYPDGALTNKLNAHATKPIPDPRAANPQVPDGVVAVLHRMMAKKPDERYQTPAELLDDLSRATLSRETVTDSLLQALAQEDSREYPVARKGDLRPAEIGIEDDPTPVRAKRKRAPSDEDDSEPAPRLARRPEGGPSLPPRETADAGAPGGPRKRRTLADVADTPGRGDSERTNALLRYLPAVALVALLLGVGGYAATRIGSAITTQGAHNPFAGGGDAQPVVSDVGGPAINNVGEAGANDPQNPSESNSGGRNTGPQGSDALPRRSGDPGIGVGTAARVEIGRESERDQIPVWVAGIPTLADVAAGRHLGALRTFRVGREGNKPGDFATLNDALASLPKDGGIIRLHGSGPFTLRPIQVLAKDRVLITAAPGSEPVIHLQPDFAGRGTSVLRLASTSLEIVGVHLVAVAGQFVDSGEVTLIDSTTGDVSLRQSSVTVLGTRESPVTAVRVSADAVRPDRTPANSGRVLLDRVFGRGDPLSLVAVAQSATDLVASNCAVVSGTGPIVRVMESPTLQALPAASGKKSGTPRDEAPVARMLRFFSCTFTSRGPAFDFRPKDSALPVANSSVLLMNSIVGTDAAGTAANSLLDLGGWPHDSAGLGRPLFENLTIDIPSTVFAGWKNYVASNMDSARAISGASSWDLVWRTSTSQSQFSVRAFPGQPLSNLAAVAPADLSPGSAAASGVRATGGGTPGADVSEFVLPPPELVARAGALAERPVRLPVVSSKDGASPDLTIDASRDDVGRTISNGSWSDGALIRVTGAGQRKSSPIVLKGKSARIEIDDALMLDLDFKSGTDAFVSVTNGSIDISGGRFRIAASKQGTIPKWFLSVTNGSFALEGCYVNGPMLSGPRYEGLIRWNRLGDGPVKELPGGYYEHYGRLTNCYLASFGTFLIADLRGRAFSMQNCAAVALEDAFDLNLGGPDNRIASALELRDSTVSSAGGAFFRVKTASWSQASEVPLRFFVERTAFVSAVDPGNGLVPRPTLLAYTGPLREQKQAEWWGIDNGYGQLRQWIRGDNDPAAEGRSIEEGWLSVWGPGHELRPLSGKGSVVVRGGFQARTKLVPSGFAVDPRSDAGRWNPAGGPIGADVSPLDEPEKGEKDAKKDKKSPFVRPNF